MSEVNKDLIEDGLQLKSIDDSPAEIESTIAFLNGLISHPINRKIWEWEFNAFRNSTVLKILARNGETRGTQFMLPIPLQSGDQKILSGKCENSYFHPDHRGKGLFEKLFKTAVDDAAGKSMNILWAFTPATKSYEKKLGFTVFDKSMHTFSGFFGKPDREYLKSSVGNSIKRELKYLYYLLKYRRFLSRYKNYLAQIRYRETLKGFEVKNALGTTEEINGLFEKIRAQYKDLIHVELNKPYLDWRITNNVNLEYTVRSFYSYGELVGFYLFSTKNFSANLCDFTFLTPVIAKTMMGHLIAETLRSNAMLFRYFGNIENDLNKTTFSLLQQLGGQLTITSSMPFVFKVFTGALAKADHSSFNLPQNWYLNGLWTEGFNY